jgi:hypothetical protein
MQCDLVEGRVARNQNYQFGYFLGRGLGMYTVVIFYDHLEYFEAIWYNLWPFGIVCGPLECFSPFWYVWTKKDLATLIGDQFSDASA